MTDISSGKYNSVCFLGEQPMETELGQQIGIGRARIRPPNGGGRRKLGKAFQSARAQANILKQERFYSG